MPVATTQTKIDVMMIMIVIVLPFFSLLGSTYLYTWQGIEYTYHQWRLMLMFCDGFNCVSIPFIKEQEFSLLSMNRVITR